MRDADQFVRSFFDDQESESSPAFRMSQTIGSASRVAAVLARSLKGGPNTSARNGIATIPETPFTAAFAEPLPNQLASQHPIQEQDELSSGSEGDEEGSSRAADSPNGQPKKSFWRNR